MNNSPVFGRLPVWMGLCVLFLSVLFVRPLAAGDDFDEAYDMAGQNFRRGNYPEALRLYKKANGIRDNTNSECLWGLAQTYSKMGAHKNAIEMCDQLIKLGEKDPENLIKSWNMRGGALSAIAMANPAKKDIEKLREAELSFRELLKLSPQSGMAHYNLGLVLIWLGRMDDGLAELRAFVSSGEEGEPLQKARKILENPRRASDSFAPDFSGVTSDGSYISSEDLKGKVFLLDFWGVWCPPCRDSVPYLSRLNKRFSKSAFVLVSIDVNDEESMWREYIGKNKMDWTHVRDANNKIRQAFQVNSFPTYILVDHEGIIISRSMGAGPQTEDVVDTAVKKALKSVAAKQ